MLYSDVGLSKLSEQLLQITLDKDGVSAINSYNVAKKYSVLSANQRALSDSKVNKLQEWLKDFKTRRTKITKSKYANIDVSRPICSTPLKPIAKQKIHEKNVVFTPIVVKENFATTLPQTPLSTLPSSKNCDINEQKNVETKILSTFKPDLTQCTKPLFIPTTQQTNTVTSMPVSIAPINTAFSLGSKPLPTSTIVTPIWNPSDSTSTSKSATSNDLSNKFDYKVFSNNPALSSANTTPLFGNNVASIGMSNKVPVDFSFKPSLAAPTNYNDSPTVIPMKSALDIISGTTESKDKIPFSFTNVSIPKTEITTSMTNPTVAFNFADSIKNKMDNPKVPLLTSFSFETPKSSSKLSETPSTFTELNVEDKSKDQVKETPSVAFNFSSKPDASSFSTFSFNAPNNDLKTTASETKSIFTTTTSTSVAASFSFTLPAKPLPAVVSEPAIPSTVSSTIETVKTTPILTTVSAGTSSNIVTDTNPQVSESPTPIISEPVTPESENFPTTPITSSSVPIFEIPPTSTSVIGTSVIGTSVISTSTTNLLGSSANTTSTTSIISPSTITTSTPSIFSSTANVSSVFSTTNTTSASIFGTLTNTTSSPSIFGTPTNTTSTTSIFGTPTSATTASSLFGTPSNPTTASAIFGASATTTSSSIFGNPIKTTSSIFGTPNPSTMSSMFGSPTSTNTTSGFGSTAQTTSVFGSPATTGSSIFGSATVPASSSSIFGSAPTTSSSIFGTPAQTSTTSSIFGSPSTTAASSGLFGSVAAAANQPSSFGQSSLGFSSPGSAFGNMSLFGQQACSPSQPASSFAPPANPFAVNKTPSSTSSLFSGQKTVFGQPTARY